MALANVDFKLVEGRYQSDPITVTGTSVGIQIDMEKMGDVMLQMSVDGVKYANNTFIKGDDTDTLVGIVGGAIPGMLLRLQFYGIGKPSKIQIIQS